jgi:hypothetical protein
LSNRYRRRPQKKAKSALLAGAGKGSIDFNVVGSGNDITLKQVKFGSEGAANFNFTLGPDGVSPVRCGRLVLEDGRQNLTVDASAYTGSGPIVLFKGGVSGEFDKIENIGFDGDFVCADGEFRIENFRRK